MVAAAVGLLPSCYDATLYCLWPCGVQLAICLISSAVVDFIVLRRFFVR